MPNCLAYLAVIGVRKIGLLPRLFPRQANGTNHNPKAWNALTANSGFAQLCLPSFSDKGAPK
jgi:hypothetical protein